jgi:hypothetical protein
VICFNTTSIHIFSLVDLLSKRHNWQFTKTNKPLGAHFAITDANYHECKNLAGHVKDCMDDIKANPENFKSSDVALYGMACDIPDIKVFE